MARASLGALLQPLVLALLGVGVAGAAAPAAAQWISPGELSRFHAELDGDRSCTQCHVLRERGVQARLCLECHAPLARRIQAGKGYHADKAEEDCGECHREHFGRDLVPMRLDTASFHHAEEAGFQLQGAHGDVGCQECHRAELIPDTALAGFDGLPGHRDRTFLGLPTTCEGCHVSDDPHGGQFADRSCDACHDEVDWTRAPRFDHDRARYRLTGRHRDVACDECHTPVDDVARYTSMAFGSCESCHADPHGAAMVGACSSCHSTRGWLAVGADDLGDRFRHEATRFPLVGAHVELDCDACHTRTGRTTAELRIRVRPGTEGRAFPLPTSPTCRACHVDAHHGELRGSASGVACDGCHGSETWVPTTYDIARHDRLAEFPLTGAHLATPCADCHRDDGGQLTLKLSSTTCNSCHAADDPHEGRFGDDACDVCHGTGSFKLDDFDHGQAGGRVCLDCHDEDDPHGGQFPGKGCDACHSTTTYAIPDFPHDQTGFHLDGAHVDVPCSGCHTPEPDARGEPVVRWVDVPVECEACHGGGR